MSDLNKVQLIGRLDADPEMVYTASGAAIANLRVATSNRWKDKQTGEAKEATEWHRVSFFNRQAEICGEYLQKGSQCYIEGRLRTRKWVDKDGNDRYTTEIVGERLQLLGGKPAPKQEERKQSQTDDAPPPVDTDDDIPF